MPTTTWKRRVRPGWHRSYRRLAPVLRAVRPVLLIASVIGAIGFIALWLCFEHRPAWYRPVRLDEAGMKRARRESAAVIDSVGDWLFRSEQFEPTSGFEIVLTEREVAEGLTVLRQVWPAAGGWWPPEFTDPAVRLTDDRILAGAHFESVGWRAILSIEFHAAVSADGEAVELALLGAYAGSLRFPRVILERLLRRYAVPRRSRGDNGEGRRTRVISTLHDVESVEQLFQGVRIRNRFVWPNGKRPFRVDSITIEEGTVRIRIEAL